MMRVLEQAVAKIEVLPEERQRAAAEALETIAAQTRVETRGQPGVDLRWPASAIWRPGEPTINVIGLADLRDALHKGVEDFKAKLVAAGR